MEYRINYEALYNRVKKYINDQYDRYFKKENENHTIENSVRVEVYGALQAALIGFEKQTENFEERYNLVNNHICDMFEHWKNEFAKQYSVENSTRHSEYFHMEALLIGYEKNARDEAIDEAYTNRP